MIGQTGAGVVPLSPALAVNPKRTNNVLQKPDNSKSYRQRFARKGQGGLIEQAYGFDLSPILARAAEFRELAEAVAAERKVFRLVKERLTICRRDVVKLIDAGINESVPGDWRGFQRRYEAIVGRLPRTAPRQVLEAIASDIEDLWVDVHQTLELFVKSQNPDANESHSGRHIQNSNSNYNPTGESGSGSGNKAEAGRDAEHNDNVRSLPQRDVPLGMVLSACPEIVNYAPGAQIRTWRDFATAADRARPSIGVSPSAWQEAVEIMGSQNASITLAAILQRAEHIRSCGGYLRDLTEKARAKKFSVWPMITALLNARMGALEKAAAGQNPASGPKSGGACGPEFDRNQRRAARKHEKEGPVTMSRLLHRHAAGCCDVTDEPGAPSTVDQVLDRGRRPFRAAAGRALVQTLELADDVAQRQVPVRGMDAGHQRPQPVFKEMGGRLPEQGGIGEMLGDPAI